MVSDSFTKAWDIFRQDMGGWVATTFVWSIAASVAGSFVPLVGGMVLLPNMVREASDAVEQRRSPDLGNVFKFDHLGEDFISMLLYCIAQTVGLLACCVGWPVAWIAFWYTAELAADGRVSESDTMKVSWMWAKDHIGETLGMAMVGLILNTIGATVGLGVGVIFTLPITVIAWVVYWHAVRDDVYALAEQNGFAVAPREPAGQLAAEVPMGQAPGATMDSPRATDGTLEEANTDADW